jgi:hypothetical protein
MISLGGIEVAQTSSSVASRLWVHLQKNLSSKSTTPLQACFSSSTHVARTHSDDLLAEVEQQSKRQHKPPMRTTPNDVVERDDPNGLQDNCHDIFTLQEIEDDLLLDVIPRDLGLTVDYLGEKRTDTLHLLNDYPIRTSSASLKEPSLQESQRGLGTAQTELPSAEPENLEEGSLFEELEEHDVESTEDLLLAF